MISRWTRVRMALFGLVTVVLAFLVGRGAFNLTMREVLTENGERVWLKELAEDNYLKEIELPARRGRILDRRDEELASTADFDSIRCNPRQLLRVVDGVSRLAKALELDPRELRSQIEKRKKSFFYLVKRAVSSSEAEAVLALRLPGVGILKEPKRIYPRDGLGAPVVGLVSREARGQEGVELAFEKYLAGAGSKLQGIRDAGGRELLVDGSADPTATAGKDVVLALDTYLQYVTETALKSALEKHNAKSAVSIMMDPQTGEVLAMATVPGYNPNDPKSPVARNRAVTDPFEPGSTMKTFTFAAALEAGTLRLEDKWDCQMGRRCRWATLTSETHIRWAF